MIFKTNIVREIKGPTKCKFCQGTQLACYNQKTGAMVLPTWECANCGALYQMAGVEERSLFDRVYILNTPTPILLLAIHGLDICDYRIVNLTSFAQNYHSKKYQTVMIRGQISKTSDFHKGIESIYIEKEDAEDGMAILPYTNENLKWIKDVMKYQASLAELYKEKPDWNLEQSKNIFDISGIKFPTVTEVLNPDLLKSMGVRGHDGKDPNMYPWQQVQEEKVNHILHYLVRVNKTIHEVSIEELNENLPIVQTQEYNDSDLIEARNVLLKKKIKAKENTSITISETTTSPIVSNAPPSDPYTDLTESIKENKGILPVSSANDPTAVHPTTVVNAPPNEEFKVQNTEPPVAKKRTRRTRAEMEAARALEAENKAKAEVAKNATTEDPMNTQIVTPPSEPKDTIQLPTTPEVPVIPPPDSSSPILTSPIDTTAPVTFPTQTNTPLTPSDVIVTNEESKSRTDELLSHMTLKPMTGGE